MKLKSILFVGAVFVMAAMSWTGVSKALDVNGLAADTHPDLSGAWQLDLAKSDFGQTIPPPSQINEIEHKDPKLKVKIKSTPQGDVESETDYTTDGAENTSRIDTLDVKSTASGKARTW